MTEPGPTAASPRRLAFAGTPEFAATALRELIAAGFDVPLVLTQPDRPAGRGLKMQASPVKQLALAHGVSVIQPRSLRLDGKFPEDAAAAFKALQAAGIEVMVVAAYGLILPPWVLALPPRGCLNIHASLLPRWRGAAPIHRAIEAGDATTGITIMQMDAGLDTGAMLLWQAEAILPDDSTGSLHDRLAALGGRLVVAALGSTALTPTVQPTAGVTYAHKVEKAEAQIDWTRPAVETERRVRAFDPFPGCHFEHGGAAIKLWRTRVVPSDPSHQPGTRLLRPGLVVACGEGALELLELQRPGGRRQPAASLGLKCAPGEPIDRA